MSLERYAIFFSPPLGTQSAQLGAAWLGRDIDTGRVVARPRHPGLSPARAAQLIANPRRYGFHATLRAPFHPAEGVDREVITELTASLAARLAPVTIPRLALRRISAFFALLSADHYPEIEALAAACIQAFDSVRAPLNRAELTRRCAARLSERQMRLLARWGYPYVMEEFRFHMTLTGRIDHPDAGAVRHALEDHFNPLLDRPMHIDALSLVYQPSPDQSFQRIGYFPLNSHATVILPSPESASKVAWSKSSSAMPG